MTLKDEILKLREQGNSYRNISEKLGCALSCVGYHVSEKTKNLCLERNKKQRKNPLHVKLQTFFDLHSHGVKAKIHIRFSLKDLIEKIGTQPRCYLSGRKIKLEDRQSYALDHIVPVARGGANTLENCNIIDKDVNVAKSDKTPEEFLELCKEILKHNGYKVTKLL